jgi:HEAT repeat protein
VAAALVTIGAPAVEPLIAALTHRRLRVRQQAARALGRIGDARAVEPLIAALGDRVARVRRAAAEALERVGDARAAEPLIARLTDERDGDVRRAAARALAALAGREPVVRLRAALPPLRRLSRGWLPDRLVFRDAARKIEAATESLKDLPVPGAAPADLFGENLPVPAACPPASAEGRRLPPRRRPLTKRLVDAWAAARKRNGGDRTAG